VSNECLEKSRQPYPGSFACSWLLYAFYDRDAQTAKNKQEIKTELQVRVEQGARDNAAWIGPVNSAKVQIELCFFPSDQMTTRSLDSNHTPLRQIALDRLTVRIIFAAAA
jgi:hypothetical protein